MRFGLIHRLMTDALATLGVLALITSSELTTWVRILVVVGLVFALAMPQAWQEKPTVRHISMGAPVALLVVQIARWMLGATLLPLAVEFAAAIQVVRLATRRGAAHDQQVLVLALLHLIAGTVLGGGLAYGLCFFGFLIIAPGALVLSHLRREVEGNYRQGARDRTGLPVDVPRILRSRRVIGKQFLAFTCMLSVPLFVLTGLLFVLFPRAGLSLLLLSHSRPERMIGFSDRVDLGGVGKLRSDPTIAMRVIFPDLPENPPVRRLLYLRGTAFDQYDGRTWSRTLKRRTPVDHFGSHVPLTRPGNPETDLVLRVELEPIDPPVVFLPPSTVALKLLPRGTSLLGHPPTIIEGPEDEVKYLSSDDRGLHYQVYIGPEGQDAPTLAPVERQRYLSLPDTVGDRISQLARSWVGAETDPFQQAKLVEQRLRTHYQYDLESPSGGASKPLHHFLFESKRGHCEFYSTAMAVLLRSLGIPSRNVTGFIGGTYNRFGEYYAVRQGDAHSWIEAFIDGRGWTRFDPTPPSGAVPQSEVSGVLASVRDMVEALAQRWSLHVVGYDRQQRDGLFAALRASYTEFTQGSERLRVSFASPRRLLMILAGLALIVGALWLLRKKRHPKHALPTAIEAERANAIEAAEMYRSLERALAACGVPRVESTPPLAHALGLQALNHPVAEETLELTRIYVEVRFGSRPLTDALRREYGERVRAMRQSPIPTKEQRAAA